MARYGRANLTLHNLATAMHPAPATIRRYLSDLDRILFEFISHHLMAISRALAPDHPEIILDLLDNPSVQPPHIETMLGALLNPASHPAKTQIITYPRQTKPKASKPPRTPFPTSNANARAGQLQRQSA